VISTIIISYNTKELTHQAIKSVMADAKRSRLILEVIVVDNASTDNSLTMIQQLLKQHRNIRLIANHKNVGFAKANNQAIQQAKGEFIFLLNSDTEVLPGTVRALIEDLQRNKHLGLVAAKLLNLDKTLQYQGGDLPTLGSVANQMFFLDDLPLIGKFFHSPQKKITPTCSPTYLGWVGGTALMIRHQLINEIGLLDENIFMYSEDVDYSIRAHQASWQVAIEPKAQVIHYKSASSSSTQAIKGEFTGLIYLFHKHHARWQSHLLKLILKAGATLRVLVFAIIGKKEKSATYKKILNDLN